MVVHFFKKVGPIRCEACEAAEALLPQAFPNAQIHIYECPDGYGPTAAAPLAEMAWLELVDLVDRAGYPGLYVEGFYAEHALTGISRYAGQEAVTYLKEIADGG
jgi:hypothetical protein